MTPPQIGQPNATEDVDTVNAFNALQTWANGNIDESNFTTGLLQRQGLNGSGTIGRGAVSIAATESRTNVAYGTLTTPDQVSGVVLPTNGLILVGYHATWQNSVANAASAAIFIGANQLKTTNGAGSTVAQETTMFSGSVNSDVLFGTSPLGLASANWGTGAGYTGDVTTGQVVGANTNTTGGPLPGGGFCAIFAAAGTYTVSIQFKASSGTVTVKNRRLWVRAEGYS